MSHHRCGQLEGSFGAPDLSPSGYVVVTNDPIPDTMMPATAIDLLRRGGISQKFENVGISTPLDPRLPEHARWGFILADGSGVCVDVVTDALSYCY